MAKRSEVKKKGALKKGGLGALPFKEVSKKEWPMNTGKVKRHGPGIKV